MHEVDFCLDFDGVVVLRCGMPFALDYLWKWNTE